MIKARFVATLRADSGKTAQIFTEEVAIPLLNAFHSKPEDTVKNGDVISLLPPVGGG